MQVEIKPPNISESTMKEMVKFFMRTSIPRIIEAERKKKHHEHPGTATSRNHQK